MKSGEAIETAIIGREGVIGASVGTNGSKSAGQVMVQIAGSAWQIPRAKFSEVYTASARFRTLTNQFQTVLLLQAQQSAACHALHPVEARRCRWLLQSQDVTESDVVPLTQAIPYCAGRLIQYRRGQIKIIDRTGLMDSACECYEAVREYVDTAVPPRP
jgi:hypothetical protein